MPQVNEILDLMDSPTKEDIELIVKAYNFAENAHRDQKRYTGEPYFGHLVETAKNLANIGMGSTTIAAGLLHDSIEDVNVKAEEVEKEFGKEVLFLVEGVTKLGHLRYLGNERHVESLRKLFIAISEDVRVLIIKLADRLHNMRTLQHVPKHKQKRIAQETLEIYAPLAYRIGIRTYKRELEDLAFSFINPEEFEKTKKMMKQKGKEISESLQKFSKSMRKEFGREGMTVIKTDSRVKNMYSLYQKLLRKDWDIDKIYDLEALRVIVPTVSDCYKVLGIVHSIWRPLPGRIKDYIAFPKPNGYQGLHTTIFTGNGTIVEIQIRTEEMHERAEYGIASHIAFKEKQNKKEPTGYFVWLKNLLPGGWGGNGNGTANGIGNANEAEKKSTKKSDIPTWIRELAEVQAGALKRDQFMEDLKSDFVRDRVFVFTPKGDVVDLPIDSCPIDFAYAIHSDIGDHIFGAQVNGKHSPLSQPLRNGDIVEIQTRKSSKPSGKWLDIVKTSMAKKHIRAVLEKQVKVRQ
ncbi:MAG: HD domain-containing protein [Candidatus Pacebacteria bacterium]|nr:HD domain-containing protein [Candidatus Paceibacterota bacterium]MDD5068943.1 HD domain-containing protein [Candidatus Paceibacterota bacterium]MDD5357420.1 HD domain-containing protein [Candidatus Paceibacterota bacterium]